MKARSLCENAMLEKCDVVGVIWGERLRRSIDAAATF